MIGGLRSGANQNRYELQLVYIDREGRWWGHETAEGVLRSGEALADVSGGAPSGFQGFPEPIDAIDIWYPVLHGPNGEDGTIQGLFQLTRKPFVGAGVLGSAVSMDKQAMKAAFAAAGLAQVPYIALEASALQDPSSRKTVLDQIESELSYPAFVKPANLGSSVGISKVRNRNELEAGLDMAAAHDPKLVVEQGITARELECAVLGSRELKASVVGEIRFDADWYDYETKYTAGSSSTRSCPLSEPVHQRPLPGHESRSARSARLDFSTKGDHLSINRTACAPFTVEGKHGSNNCCTVLNPDGQLHRPLNETTDCSGYRCCWPSCFSHPLVGSNEDVKTSSGTGLRDLSWPSWMVAVERVSRMVSCTGAVLKRDVSRSREASMFASWN